MPRSVGTQAALVEVEIAAEIEAAIATGAAVREELQHVAEKGAAICTELAPVGPKEHTLRGGYVDEPGEYKESFYASTVFVNGRWMGRFGSRNWKAWILEFGTKKMEPIAVVHRAAAQLGAE